MSLKWGPMLHFHSICKCFNFVIGSAPVKLVNLLQCCNAAFDLLSMLVPQFTLQKLAVDVLKEIQAFLVANPSEIVTIFIEDYVTSPSGLSKVFDAAGLKTYMFPISRMPKDGKDWPTVDDMAKNNQRLVVFTSKSSKEASDGIAYEWNYVVENQCESSLKQRIFFWEV